MARTLIACLPRLFQTLLESLTKNTIPVAADFIIFGIISMIFFFVLITICCVYYENRPDEEILMSTSNIPKY